MGKEASRRMREADEEMQKEQEEGRKKSIERHKKSQSNGEYRGKKKRDLRNKV